MKKVTSSVLAGTLTAALAATFAQPAGAAMRGDAPSQADQAGNSAVHRKDNRPGPLTREQNELRAAAVEKLREGKADKQPQSGGGSTVAVGKDKAVEFFDNEKQARILTVLSEFGTATDLKYGGDAGPLHNQIPQPDRSKDNSTTWAPSFDTAHYNEMFNGSGESFKNYYEAVSGGVYSPQVTVEDWVKVPYNGAYYGSNPREDEGGAWDFIEDSANAWFTKKVRSLRNTKAVNDYLAQFDVWDRYDYNNNGNFNEPDGYIDHFQAIHAGEGEEAGASADAIWSHRWYVNATDFGKTGPTLSDGTQVLYGGTRIGNSNYYIGDYTVEPENGGVGVFAHEYGHDLGLPDFYDTSGGDNGTAFWTLMSSGSWLSHGGTDGIGTTPGLMGPDERMFLGWLDYETVDAGKSGTYTLASAADPSPSNPQAVVVNLPDKTTSTQYVSPKSGSKEWWSGRGDGLNNTLTREVPMGNVSVSAAAWYSIEQDYDYLYAEYSTDGGNTWKQLDKLTGDSGGNWTTLSYSYSSVDRPTLLRFRYQTDGGVNLEGAFLDDISVSVGGATPEVDGAEDSANSLWTGRGWEPINGTVTVTTPQYYLLENRFYTGYDQTLRQGPYNFSEAVTRPNWVEFFPYQDGMLVWYADKSYADNNTSEHPGHGQALPVDARPAPFYYTDHVRPGNRRQPFDATFGLESTDHITLHRQVATGRGGKFTTYVADVPSSPGIPTFDDSNPDAYWSSKNPWSSTKVAGVGVTATVLSEAGGNITVQVVNPAQ